jgi:hypothetical protein
LTPPRPGTLDITAAADGYRPLAQPIRSETGNPPRDVEIEIRLEPQGDTVQVRLTLPDGSPAAGAEALRIDSAFGSVLFSGSADAAGVVDVPAEPSQGLLLLKHPHAAFGILDWNSHQQGSPVEWTFPPAAENPLSIRVLEPSGEEPAGGAQVAVWLTDWKLSGMALGWLTASHPITDQHGYWVGHGFPRNSVRVLSWDRRLDEQARLGALDSLATEIPFPWPRITLDVRSVR